MDYLIDDLLLYSQCPMKLFFSKYLGIDDNSTLRGQINNMVKACATHFLSNYLPDMDKYNNAAYRKFNEMSLHITPPSSIRGSDRRRDDYNKSIHDARYMLERFISNIMSMDPNIIGAPYPYTLVLNNHLYTGYIDCVYRLSDTYVCTLDMGANSPSQYLLDYGIRSTINSYAFRQQSKFKYIDTIYWILGNHIIDIYRSDGQYNTMLREMDILAGIVEDCIENKKWYRRYGYWCNGCSVSAPCNESSRVV